MTRVKKAVNALKNRRNTLKMVKGYRFGRSTKERQANEAIFHAGTYAFAHRRDKKNDFRQLWNVAISTAVRPKGLSYSKFINQLKKKNVGLDRKVLTSIIRENPTTFDRIFDKVK